MPKLFAATIALFLLLGAGYGILQAARATPWDCSDWQAFAHDDRTTAILESLAENRGKTLYCGIDQSDTFAKAETWQAGKDRNERDDTVYFGERGQFRGFIAAQEGWLTEGESGITGQSESVIFEFPREERRVRRTKRFTVGTDAAQFPINAATSCGPVLGLICAGERYHGGLVAANSIATARRWGRNSAMGARMGLGFNEGHTNFKFDWRTNRRLNLSGTDIGAAWPSTADWTRMAAEAAGRACRARGARYAAGSADFGPGHSENRGSGNAYDRGMHLGFFLREQWNSQRTALSTPTRQSRTWTARCKKVVRRNR